MTISLYVGSICTCIASALLLHPPQSERPQDTGLDPAPEWPDNTTTPATTNHSFLSIPTGEVLDQGPNTSPSKLNLSAQPIFYCNELWGGQLNLQMCEEALASIPAVIGPWKRRLTFGPREAKLFDIGLPRRFMSCGFPSFPFDVEPV